MSSTTPPRTSTDPRTDPAAGGTDLGPGIRAEAAGPAGVTETELTGSGAAAAYTGSAGEVETQAEKLIGMPATRRFTPAMAQLIAVGGMWVITAVTLGVLVFIIGYILSRGIPHLTWTFLTQSPRAMGREGGVLPIIIGTLWVTLLAVLIAAPVGVATAVYLTEYTREGKLTAVIRFGADCLAGVPSIIFGLFGFVFFVNTLGMGLSILSGALTLALMVLPTIIRTSEVAIRSVPRAYREVSFGLGSTRWQMVTQVVLRSALPGIVTGIVLSIGRSISETAVVLYTSGTALGFPESIYESSRTLSLHFYILSREGISMPNAYATATILILAILVINVSAYALMRKFVPRAA